MTEHLFQDGANYYIYRNLTKGCFSVKHRGKVIAHCKSLYIKNGWFQVSAKGQQRAVNENIRNVHAYAVAKEVSYGEENTFEVTESMTQAHYNPFEGFTVFRDKYNNQPLTDRYTMVLKDGKVFVETKEFLS